MPSADPDPDSLSPRPAGLSANLRGMLWMLGAASIFTLGSAIIKDLAQTLPLFEIVFFRLVLGALATLPLTLKAGPGALRTRRFGTHFIRALFGIGAFVFYVYAISNMLLANATALAFTSPLWMIPIAWVWLGERAGPWRIGAAMVGFTGVLIIARPDIEISLPALAALAGACLMCLAMILVKQLSTTESPEKMAFYTQALGALFALPPTLLAWQAPNAVELAWLVIMGLISAIGLLCQARAYGTGDPTAVAPVDYTRLPMAILLGVFLFDELPDGTAFTGMAIILAAVLFLSYRERRARKRA